MDDPKAPEASGDQDRRARLNQRLRQAFIEGAEADSRRRLGRGLTAEEELERVLRRYPGDLGVGDFNDGLSASVHNGRALDLADCQSRDLRNRSPNDARGDTQPHLAANEVLSARD
jgi:hypothetical protein